MNWQFIEGCHQGWAFSPLVRHNLLVHLISPQTNQSNHAKSPSNKSNHTHQPTQSREITGSSSKSQTITFSALKSRNLTIQPQNRNQSNSQPSKHVICPQTTQATSGSQTPRFCSQLTNWTCELATWAHFYLPLISKSKILTLSFKFTPQIKNFSALKLKTVNPIFWIWKLHLFKTELCDFQNWPPELWNLKLCFVGSNFSEIRSSSRGQDQSLSKSFKVPFSKTSKSTFLWELQIRFWFLSKSFCNPFSFSNPLDPCNLSTSNDVAGKAQNKRGRREHTTAAKLQVQWSNQLVHTS